MAGLPQTNATPEQRIATWDALVKKDATQVWKFAQDYFNGGVMGESHQFRWRDTGGNRRALEQESNESYQEYAKGIRPRLTDLACRRIYTLAGRFKREIAHKLGSDRRRVVHQRGTRQITSMSARGVELG